MALPSIGISAFTGFVNISQDTYLTDDIDDFISRGIDKHIKSMLGEGAYRYVRDNAHPAYTALFAGVDWTDSEEDDRVCESFTDVLKMMIYADWTFGGHVVNSATGPVINLNENATDPVGMMGGALGTKRLARAQEIWEESICDFIQMYREVEKEITTVDNTDHLNPICTVDDAIFLQDGDTVSILGVDYTAASVSATDFTVNVAVSGLGSSFVGELATWQPFGKVKDNLGTIKVGYF